MIYRAQKSELTESGHCMCLKKIPRSIRRHRPPICQPNFVIYGRRMAYTTRNMQQGDVWTVWLSHLNTVVLTELPSEILITTLIVFTARPVLNFANKWNKAKFHNTDFPVTSATSPRTGKFRGSRRNKIWASPNSAIIADVRSVFLLGGHSSGRLIVTICC